MKSAWYLGREWIKFGPYPGIPAIGIVVYPSNVPDSTTHARGYRFVKKEYRRSWPRG